MRSPCTDTRDTRLISTRVLVDVAGVEIPFIALEDLRRNKRAAGRHQDLADLADLEALEER